MPVIKGYSAAFNHVFAFAGMYLAADGVISRLFSRFKKTFLPREIKPPEWNLSVVLKSYSSAI